MADNCDLSHIDAVSVDGKRTRLRLTKKLGGGGEGLVCEGLGPAGQRFAVKLFRDHKLASKMPKIRAMLKSDPEQGASERHIAWPLALAQTQGAPVGYVMAIMDGLQLIHATEPQHRWDLKYNLDLFSLHWLAENLASAVEKLHAIGHVCGDFKDQNALFNPATLEVFLIDTDSYGVSSTDRFPPDAYTEDWSPPEFLRSRSRRCRGIGKEHDNFSLAVLYHHLLFGVHPFSGEVSGSDDDAQSIVDAIKEGRWLYRHGPQPNEHSTPLAVVSPSLQSLFQRAFIDGHTDPGRRPTAKEWRVNFREARWDLRWCDKHPLHVFDCSPGTCPWCARQPDLWGSPQGIRSPTRDRAIEELGRLKLIGDSGIEAFDRAKRRLDANPSFRTQVSALVDRIDQIEGVMRALRSAGDDELALIAAADRILRDPYLKGIAQRQGLGQCLNQAAQRHAVLERCDALISGAAARNGRYVLSGERKLVSAFERETQLARLGDLILSRYLPRIDAAKARIHAADALEQALAGNVFGEDGPVSNLHAVLTEQGERLAEIADDAVGARLGVARSIVELDKNIAVSAEACPDDTIVRDWDRYVALISNLGILDVSLGPALPSLRQLVQRSRESIEAIGKLAALLQQPVDAFDDNAERDRAVVAADPAGLVSERGREAFKNSPASEQLEAARARLEVTERLERLAASVDRDRYDLEFVRLWREAPEPSRLVLSRQTSECLAVAQERVARLDQIRAIADRRPPDDEALLAALTKGADDLLGLELHPGETLGARVDLAKQRIDTRDQLARLIERADVGQGDIAAETAIVRGWDAARQFRQQTPGLFRRLVDRAELARRRVRYFEDLKVALSERHGACLEALWKERTARVQEFAPVSELADAVDSLLVLYREFLALAKQAESGLDDDALLTNADQARRVLDLKDAGQPRPDLGGHALRAFLERLRNRRLLQQHGDWLDGMSLDPARLRWSIAQVFPTDPAAVDLTELGDSAVDNALRAAVQANRSSATLRDVITAPDFRPDNFRIFLRLWDEAWHPLLPSTAPLVEQARQFAAATLGKVAVRNVRLEQAEGGRPRIRWDWPLAAPGEDGAPNGSCQMMVIAVGSRNAADPRHDAETVVHVFRCDGKPEGEIEIAEAGDRLDATLIAGCVIGSEPIYSDRPVRVQEQPDLLTYRFAPANWRQRSDVLLLSSPRPMWTPRLKIIHDQSGRTLARIESRRVGSSEIRIDLSSNIVKRRGLKRNALRRLIGSPAFIYRLDFAERSDGLRVQLLHPQSTREQQLSVAWF